MKYKGHEWHYKEYDFVTSAGAYEGAFLRRTLHGAVSMAAVAGLFNLSLLFNTF